MKRIEVLTFIFAVILVLGGICYVFPKDGLTITLRFSTLDDIMGKEKEEEKPEVSVEDILAMSEKNADIAAEKDSLLKFFNTSPTRFYLPNNDLHFFDTLFAQMEKADSSRIRILHYGDSQLEEDRMTFVIRDTLQKIFGGDGQGMMPARSHYTFSMAGSASGSFTRYMIFAPESRCGGNKYGPFGDFVRLYGSARMSFRQTNRPEFRRRLFNQVTVVAGNTSGKGLSVTVGDSTAHFPAGELLVRAVFDMPDSSDRVSLSLSDRKSVV